MYRTERRTAIIRDALIWLVVSGSGKERGSRDSGVEQVDEVFNRHAGRTRLLQRHEAGSIRHSIIESLHARTPVWPAHDQDVGIWPSLARSSVAPHLTMRGHRQVYRPEASEL